MECFYKWTENLFRAHLDYVVKEGFISGQNYLTGITGHLTTYPDYTDLVTSTGVAYMI